MREFARVSSTFWTGETGRRLRRLGPEAQVVALYLISAPGSNMIGLYYLPLPTLCHETGVSPEGASKALRSLSEASFAHYDPDHEMVWVPEMARFQLGEALSTKDNRHKAVLSCLRLHRKCCFHRDFREKYGAAFELPEESPSEAPPKPLRSKEKDKEKEEESSAGHAAAGPGEGKSQPPRKPDQTQKPRKPRPCNPLFEALVEVTGSDPVVNGSHLGKVAALLAKADPAYTPDEVHEFARVWRELLTWAKPADHPRLTLGVVENHIPQLRASKRTAPPADTREDDRRRLQRMVRQDTITLAQAEAQFGGPLA